MIRKCGKVLCIVVLGFGTATFLGCACSKGGFGKTSSMHYTQTGYDQKDLPPGAVPGECYARVFIPPTFDTVTERTCIKEASEKVEVIPAEYEWVDEKVCVRPASTRFEEFPAQYDWKDETVEAEPGHTDWEQENSARCVAANGQPVREVWCLVNHPPVFKTVSTQYLVKPASRREVSIPAEFETVRTQKLVRAAQTRKVSIPAEFDTIQKTVQVTDGRTEWQRVFCGANTTTQTMNTAPGVFLTADRAPRSTEGAYLEKTDAELRAYHSKSGK